MVAHGEGARATEALATWADDPEAGLEASDGEPRGLPPTPGPMQLWLRGGDGTARADGTAAAERVTALTATPVGAGARAPTQSCRLRLGLGKGVAAVEAAGGPWATAVRNMPKAPVRGGKRFTEGLAHVPVTRADQNKVEREREARVLVAVLPHGAAGHVLSMREDEMWAKYGSAEAVAEDMVGQLIAAGFGASRLSGAASAYARLKAFADGRGRLREDGSCDGQVLREFVAAAEAEAERAGSDARDGSNVRQDLIEKLDFVRRECGVPDLPTKSLAARSARTTRPPPNIGNVAPYDVAMVVHLEWVAARHPSRFVRAIAAAAWLITHASMRFEQAQGTVINAVAPWNGSELVVLAVSSEKDPVRSRKRPRGAWADTEGLLGEGRKAVEALQRSLTGVEDGGYLVRDNNAPKGHPLNATAWASAPMGYPAFIRQVNAIMSLPPLSMPREEVEAIALGTQAGKRYQQCVVARREDVKSDSTLGLQLGRWTGSAAADKYVEPSKEMVRKHTLKSQTMPNVYARSQTFAAVIPVAVLGQTAVVREAIRYRLGANWRAETLDREAMAALRGFDCVAESTGRNGGI